MGWYYKRSRDIPKPLVHKHDMPTYNDDGDVEVGDIWQCTCTQYYQVDQIKQGTDGLLISWRAMWWDETRDFQ